MYENPLHYLCMISEKATKALAESFSIWLKSKMDSVGYKYASELSRESGVSAQAISGYLNPKPSPNTNKFTLPKKDTLESLARPLRCSVEEVMEAAGYNLGSYKKNSDIHLGQESNKKKYWYDAMFFLETQLPPDAQQARIEAIKEALENELKKQSES